MQKKSSTLPIAVVAVAILMLIALNFIQAKYAPKTEQQLQAEAAEASQKQLGSAQKAADEATGKTKTAALQNASEESQGDDLAGYGAEKVLNPKGKAGEVTIGWHWTPDVQNDPAKLTGTIAAIQKEAPGARIRVVNTDEHSDVPDGVTVKGKTIMPLPPDGILPTMSAKAVGLAMGKSPNP